MGDVDQKMRAQLKKILTPELERLGFVGRFPEFQLKRDGRLHLLSVQFDKWGGGFFLEFGSIKPGDQTMPWGEFVQEKDLTIGHVYAENAARLQAKSRPASSREDWFRFEGFQVEECSTLAREICRLLEQVMNWLDANRKGPNIAPLRS